MIPSLDVDPHRSPIFVWTTALVASLVAMLGRAFMPAPSPRKPASTAMSSATERLLTTTLAMPAGATFELF